MVFFSKDDISIEFLGVFKIKREKPQSQKAHERSYDMLCIRLSGEGEFTTADGSFSVGPGDLLYLPKNLDYSQKTQGETIIVIHFFNYHACHDCAAEVFSGDKDCQIRQIFTEMYNVWKEKKAGHRHKCTSLFYELLSIISRERYTTAINAVTSDAKIKKAIDYIHSNYRREDISVSELAKMCSVSETYFRKLFKQIHGVSPSQYVINLRLDFASHLLRSQLYTVSEAGYKSGFNDTKYFSKLFKSRYGSSPKKFQLSAMQYKE